MNMRQKSITRLMKRKEGRLYVVQIEVHLRSFTLLDVFEQGSIVGRCLKCFGRRLLKGMTTAGCPVL